MMTFSSYFNLLIIARFVFTARRDDKRSRVGLFPCQIKLYDCLASPFKSCNSRVEGIVWGNILASLFAHFLLLLCYLSCQFWKGSFGCFAVVDLQKELPKFCRFVPQHHVRRWRKRKRSPSEVEPSKGPDDVEATICLRYNSMLHMDFIDANEMVIVEQPWLNVIATFPPALERKLYGS